MNFWTAINNASSIATFIGLPAGVFGSIAAFSAWRNSMARVFLGICMTVFLILLGADIAVRSGSFMPNIEDIHDCYISNQKVYLDYHSYMRCHFVNVTLVYNGGPGAFRFNTIEGSLRITTDDPHVENVLSALNSFGLLNITYLSNQGKVIPPTNPIR
jgi:hypothetical protein